MQESLKVIIPARIPDDPTPTWPPNRVDDSPPTARRLMTSTNSSLSLPARRLPCVVLMAPPAVAAIMGGRSPSETGFETQLPPVPLDIICDG